MSESAYDVLARVLRDNDAEVDRLASGEHYGEPTTTWYVSGLQASGARIRAAMAGLPRTEQSTWTPTQAGWTGTPPQPLPTAPPAPGRIIDVEYFTVFDGDGRVWTMPKNIPSP